MSADLPPRRVVLITGLSGAGRSTALKVLEDEGYEAIDNLPLALLEELLVTPPPGASSSPLAVAVDVRSREFDATALSGLVRRFRARPDLALRVLFLDCDSDVLLRRFTETRRRHPLAQTRPVDEGIATERLLMGSIRDDADLVVDTSAMSGGDLRRHVLGELAPDGGARLAVFVTSFSYRHGLPRNADLVIDVRFLDNPHYVDELRPKTGRDSEVAAHIERDGQFRPFLERLMALLDLLVPGYEREGKRYLTIGIGCTGGRHRSVFVAERLGALLSDRGRAVALQHRDLGL